MPCRASTSERVCSVQFHSRSPRTAVMLADGFGSAFVGIPTGFGEMPPDPASAPEATTTASATTPRAATPSRRVVPLRTPMRPPLLLARTQCAAPVHRSIGWVVRASRIAPYRDAEREPAAGGGSAGLDRRLADRAFHLEL